MQDQLIIYMALARGHSRMLAGPLTLHTQTAIHFAQVMTGCVFKVTEQQKGKTFLIECDGIGYMSKWSQSAAAGHAGPAGKK